MAQPLEQFAKSLLASSLPFAGEFEAWLRGLPKEKRPADGEQCARVLVKEKKLTAYQAQEIYAGRGKKLVLGNYVIADKLGQGGMGVVLKAEHTRMGRLVAIKVMSTAGMKNPDAVKRFHREVQAAAKLTHQNIVTAFDADEAGGQHFLVMEYVEGSDLSQLVKKNGPMSIEKALHCILQAARGLEFAHSKGVVHRDIKPANLLLDSEGTIKILDMGLARLEHSPEQAELTGTGQVMGTVDYMAPEQAMSTKSADGRADIYSLGITLWYLLTGRVAYEGDTLMAKLMAHSTAPIPYLASVNMSVPPSLDAVFRRMIAKTPPERFQSMTEVIAALEGSRSGNVVSPTIQVQKSEDSKLSDFLRGMGPGASPGRSGIGLASPQAVATAPPPLAGSTNASFEQTIDTGRSQTDTDPQTDMNLAAPPRGLPSPLGGEGPGVRGKEPRPAPPWHADWRVWTFGSGGLGVLVLIALIVVLLMRGGQEPVGKAGGASANQRPESIPNYALRFDGTSNYVAVDSLRISDLPTGTLELFGTPSQLQIQGVLVDSDLVYLTELGNHSAGKQTWIAGARGDHVPAADGLAVVESPTHLAVVWDETRIDLYVNGKKFVTKYKTADKTSAHPHFLLAAMARGPSRPPGEFFAGVLDEVRVSNIVRYAGDFPAPTADRRFTLDKSTVALYHFDDGKGDVLKDSSGNNHHGKIVGAKWVKVSGAASPGPGLLLGPPAAGDLALEFDGSASGAMPGIRLDLSKPLTLEGYMVVTGPSTPGGWPAAFYAANRIALTNDGGFWGFRLIGGEDMKLPHQINDKRPIELGRRYHVAGVSTGKRMILFIDGKLVAEKNLDADPPIKVITDLSLAFKFVGRMDELRASQSARYLADFTPPGRLTADAQTLGLYHCDEGSGTTLKDASGGGHDGVLTKVKWVAGLVPTVAAASGPAVAPPGIASSSRPSLSFSSPTDYVQANLSPSIVRPPLTVEVIATIHRQDRIVDLVQIGDANQAIRLRYSPTLNFGFTSGGAPGWAGIGSKPPPTDKPVHLAGTWTDQAFRAYLDGSEIGAISNTTGLAPLSTLLLGGSPNGRAEKGSAMVTFHAVRISKTARNPATFAPTADFRTDADTVALYRFAEGQGEQLQDSSGSNHHGRIVGATWAAAAAPATGGWKPLFNNKDLTGWRQEIAKDKTWSVENSELVCRRGPAINHLVSTDSFGDFDLLAEVRVAPGGNSGIFFRTPGTSYNDPHELEIGTSSFGFVTGNLVGLGMKSELLHQHNEWATVELIARGKRFLSKVNGRFVDDWTDPDCLATGKIALQCVPYNTEVRFRRIDVRPAP